MKNSTAIILVILVTIFTLGVGVLCGIAIDRVALLDLLPSPTVQNGDGPDFSLIQQVWNKINQNYVDRKAVDPQKLLYGAINGMVDTLGDTGHTTFLTPDMLKSEQNYTQGELEGIGAQVQQKDGNTVIVAPIDNSPAQRAGLAAGDIILKVDGKDVKGMALTDVVNLILGPAGTQVKLTIYHPKSDKTEELTLTRAKITIQNVNWERIPGTDYADIRMSAFSNNVTDDLKKALQDAQSQGVKGIILDLRSNPGGLLDESINTASQFLKSGNVLQEKDATGKISNIGIKKGGVATDIPMVVMINQGTASASEIVSGALQDAGRAKLVGETTFGTGTVLQQFNLSDGSALLLATQEWLTPKGRVIWHNGIQPDVKVTLADNAVPIIPDSLKSMNASDVKNSSDTQFLKALELLSATP
jgi:carboxyl-terminal processing protease